MPLRQPPDNHLRLQHIRNESVLWPLAVDEVYQVHDEFNRGMNENLWGSAASQEGSYPFEFDAEALQGGIFGDPGREDDADVRFFSRLPTWAPGLRPGVQMRYHIPSISSLKFEFGFVQPVYHPSDSANANGAVNVKATPTSNMPSIAVAVYDTDDDTNLSAASATENANVNVQDTAESAFADGEHTILVWTNEHGAVSIWYDGRFHASAAALQSLESSQRGGSHLWLYVQNRAANPGNHGVAVDYINAWQERQPRRI